MADRRASDVFVSCLEAEGVKYVFGIPGEETLDLNESLSDSSVSFIPVRHEQGGAYMADMYGRLTGRAGVCLGTLGPGAMNLVTAIGDAFLDRAPLVALTGQGDLERMHKESHQYIDVVSLMKPVTKWNARLTNPRIIPEVVRKAFKVAQQQKPGATHIELPEDVMAAEVDGRPLRTDAIRRPEPGPQALRTAVSIIRAADRPIVLGRLEAGRDDDAFPMQPPRALWELRAALRPQDLLVSDVGLHKLWISRMFPAHEPNTVFIANGLAGMGIALPTAIAAKLVHPERNVVTVNGDGGFLMNAQELETAVRLRTPIVNVIWENAS